MGVLTLPEKEHECMKFLSTSCQLAIVQAAGNNIVREIHIWRGKLHITMMRLLGVRMPILQYMQKMRS